MSDRNQGIAEFDVAEIAKASELLDYWAAETEPVSRRGTVVAGRSTQPVKLDPFFIQLGGRIREIRKNRGLLQRELAKAVKVTETSVSEWETGKSGVDIRNLPKIAAALGCSYDDLVPPPDRPNLRTIQGGRSIHVLAEQLVVTLGHRRIENLMAVPKARVEEAIDLVVGAWQNESGHPSRRRR